MKNNLKFLHVCTIDVGGAFNGARRQHEMLKEQNIQSKILVRTKTSDNPDVTEALSGLSALSSKVKNVLNLALKKNEVKRDRFGTDISKHPLVKEADVIVLHWISTFLSPKEIYKLTTLPGKRVVFFMHDMWVFTGGCHVDRQCGGYIRDCVDCPMAGKAAVRSFRHKLKYLSKADITYSGPSNWIVDEAKKSAITENKQVIYLPNTFDNKVFYPRENADEIKRELGLSLNKKLILFGAADTGTANSNKGFSYLVEALGKLDMSDKQLVVIGNSEGVKELAAKYDLVTLGYIKDENKLASIYSVADVFVNPSLQESFGYTVCEAMACKTCVAAFAVGGMLDQIEHGVNGYLARYKDSSDLAKGIEDCLMHTEYGDRALKAANRFNYSEIYKYFEKIYE